jgi:hypothetical protein
MEDETLKTNLLAIAGSGLLILLTGIFFLVFKNVVSKNLRFLLPIPPLGVAAYIFVFNMYVHYGGSLPKNTWGTVKEIILSIAISSTIFAVFTIVLVVFVGYFRRFL